MNSPNDIELIVSTIAVVFDSSETRQPIDVNSDFLANILRRPLTITGAPNLTVVGSSRDQIEVQLFGNKIDVREMSGGIDGARRQIPRILHEFIGLIDDAPVQSYGINFILEALVDQPNQWLGSNLLNPNLGETFGETLEHSMSASLVSLVLDRAPKVWTIQFESLRGNKLSINFNASEHENELPDTDRLGKELDDQYGKLGELMAQLGI